MSIRFHRRITVVPGILWLNLSKSGLGIAVRLPFVGTLSFGPRGLEYHATLGGGVSYRKRIK